MYRQTSIIVRILQSYFQQKLHNSFRPLQLGDIRHNYADLSKIERVLGFVPQ